MKPKLAIVTGNELKYRELSIALAPFFECEQREISGYHEIQGTAERIFAHKLQAAYDAFKMPVLVDDVSVHFDSWNGFPGPYMKDLLTAVKPYEMGAKFKGEHVEVVCRLGICFSPEELLIAKGSVHGTIVPAEDRYQDVMHFDICVQLDGMDKPMMEFTPEEKNEFSHRGLALKELLKQLKNKEREA